MADFRQVDFNTIGEYEFVVEDRPYTVQVTSLQWRMTVFTIGLYRISGLFYIRYPVKIFSGYPAAKYPAKSVSFATLLFVFHSLALGSCLPDSITDLFSNKQLSTRWNIYPMLNTFR